MPGSFSPTGARVRLAVLALVTVGCSDNLRRWDPALEVDGVGAVQYPSLRVHGHWYAYGDSYGCPATCTNIGKHSEGDCAQIDSPAMDDGVMNGPRSPENCGTPEGANMHYWLKSHFNDFKPDDDRGMCTWGVVEGLKECEDGAISCKKGLDYSNMWGAGIGFDFNAANTETETTREPWDAEKAGIRGVSFYLDPIMDPSLIRVNFPMALTGDDLDLKGKSAVLREGLVIREDGSAVWADGTSMSAEQTLEDRRHIELGANALPQDSTSEEYPGGSPFWKPGTQGLLSTGHNEIYWRDVSPLVEKTYKFSPSRLLGIQFQVSPSGETSQSFSFCVGNFTFLR